MKHDLTLGLSGKVAIVTGAAGDIGRNTVELLLAHGVRIVAEDLSPSVKDLEQPGTVVSLCADVAEEESAKRAVALAIEHFGALDILVNNAGKTLNKPLLDTSAQEWDGSLRQSTAARASVPTPSVQVWSKRASLEDRIVRPRLRASLISIPSGGSGSRKKLRTSSRISPRLAPASSPVLW